MLHLTHITPQQSGRTARLRFHMKVKSLRYKYTHGFIEILRAFFFVNIKTSIIATEIIYYALAVERSG